MTEWTRAECAEHVGVAPATWGSYVARGRAPAPVRRIAATPLWDADEVRHWHAHRPGSPVPNAPQPARRRNDSAPTR